MILLEVAITSKGSMLHDTPCLFMTVMTVIRK